MIRYGEQDFARTGFVADISTGGVFVITQTLPPIGSRLHLQIELSSTRNVYAEGVVQRHKLVPVTLRTVEKMGFGVRFLSPGELLAEIVPQLKSPALAAVDDRFSVSFASQKDLHDAFERELKHGGIFLRTERVLPRDTDVTITLELAFANTRVELAAKVLQIVEGNVKGLGFVFDDVRKLNQTLASYL